MSTIACPTCGAPVAVPKGAGAELSPTFPFCSLPCKLADLGRWMDGQYALDPATGKLDVVVPEEDEAPN